MKKQPQNDLGIQKELVEQINKSKREYVTDGYSMSIGELVSLYKEGELDINPDFQRKFRWSLKQQSRLIESILIGVPLPSVFVYQTEKGKWEVVDGVQRISTILSFMGEMLNENGKKDPASILSKTKMLPALEKMTWEKLPKEPLQIDFRRSKIEIKIIKSQSHKNAKFEVFQRLNYAPTILSDQEYRNVLLIMANKEVYDWIEKLSNDNNFKTCVDVNTHRLNEKYDQEMVVRFFVFSYYPLKGINRIGDFLNESIFYENENSLLDRIAAGNFSIEKEGAKFKKTFSLIAKAGGEGALKKGGRGSFSEAYFEAIAIGLYSNIDKYTEGDIKLIKNKIEKIGDKIPPSLNAAQRIPKTVPFGKEYFKR